MKWVIKNGIGDIIGIGCENKGVYADLKEAQDDLDNFDTMQPELNCYIEEIEEE